LVVNMLEAIPARPAPDLIEKATLALRAVEGFDLVNTRFSTYASYWIK
jgi:DNA-directed RNA polymerase sigma subunit (sigma70/sigma32)